MNRFARLGATSFAAMTLAGLAACSDGSDAQTVDSARPTVVTSTVTPSPDMREDAQKDLGSKATVVNTDGSPLLDVSLDRFVNTTCDQQAAQTQPTNGRFVTVNLTVTTYDDPQGRLPGIELDKGWSHLAGDGKVLPANTSAAQTCHHEDLGLVGRKSYSTAVVLDVPADAPDDWVAYDVAGTHWEWKLDG